MNKDIICFHNPDEVNGYMSNWYLSKFTVDGIEFSSVEQYMMYQKAITFKDNEIAGEILKTNDVVRIKQFGRQVAGYDDKIWSVIRYNVVKQAVFYKFTQNQHLANMLCATNDAVLCECAVHDKIWGIGLLMKDPNRFNIQKWRGTNLLGKALMEVREELRRSL